MKLKKISYLLVIVLMLVIGVNGVNADAEEKTCFYMYREQLSGNKVKEFNAQLHLRWGEDVKWIDGKKDYAEVFVDIVDAEFEHDSEPLLNWIHDGYLGFKIADLVPSAKGSPEFEKFYDNFDSLKNLTTEPSCPKYLVFEINENWWFFPSTYSVWGTNSKSKAEAAVNASEKDDEFTVYYTSNQNKYGKTITAEEYYGEFVELNIIDEAQLKAFWSDPEKACEDFFGSADDEDSLRYMINTIMGYIRIIVPILIILFGTVDFAKAVIAGKEENMKKAQGDFAKRVLIGVAIFFVPLLVNVIMDLAEITWDGKDYIICDIIK